MPKAEMKKPRKTKRERRVSSGVWKYQAMRGAAKKSTT